MGLCAIVPEKGKEGRTHEVFSIISEGWQQKDIPASVRSRLRRGDFEARTIINYMPLCLIGSASCSRLFRFWSFCDWIFCAGL